MGLLRLLLALGVTVRHLNPTLGDHLMVAGFIRVELFFIISDFYMAMVLKEKYTGPGSVRLFLGNRLLRVLPTYYLLLLLPVLVTLVGRLLTGHWLLFTVNNWIEYGRRMEPALRILLALSNFTLIGQEFTWAGSIDTTTGAWIWGESYSVPGSFPGFLFLGNPPSWNLGIELLFYCLAPWLMKLRTLPLIAVGSVSAGFHYLVPLLFHDLAEFLRDHFILGVLWYFLAGALAYRVFAACRSQGHLPVLVTRGPLVFAVLLCLLFAHPFMPDSFRDLLVAGAVAFSLPFVFALTASMKGDRILGELSYPVYLVHWNMVPIWVVLVRDGWLPNFGHGWLETVVFALIVLMASAVIVQVVELPLKRYRERRRLEVSGTHSLSLLRSPATLPNHPPQ